MRIAFFGTPPFAARVLSDLIENGVNVVAVISRPDKPKGRSGHPVKGAVRLVAEMHQLPLYQPEKASAESFVPTLEALHADLFVVAAYGEILTQKILDLPKKGCINVHASLLPKYRGAAPIQRCIIQGETETGITIMYMVRKMDAGDMILKAKLPIGENTSYGELELEMSQLGSLALMEVIHQFEKGPVLGEAQNESEVTFAPKIELEECQIDWEKDAQEIHNLIRGTNPEPGAWCYLQINGEKKRLKIFSTLVRNEALKVKSYSISPLKSVLIGCGKGALELLEIQLEGKKRMSAADFYRGLTKHSFEFL